VLLTLQVQQKDLIISKTYQISFVYIKFDFFDKTDISTIFGILTAYEFYISVIFWEIPDFFNEVNDSTFINCKDFDNLLFLVNQSKLSTILVELHKTFILIELDLINVLKGGVDPHKKSENNALSIIFFVNFTKCRSFLSFIRFMYNNLLLWASFALVIA
jgi:hypothetical protein